MRCFIAIDLDPTLRNKVIMLQSELAGLDTKLVESHNLHLTLKFLGEVNEDTVKKVSDILSGISSSISPFDIVLEGVGVFPNKNLIRVVWVGCPTLVELQAGVNNRLSPFLKKEKTSPHLTLARVRSQKHKNKILEFVETRHAETFGKMCVDKIILKKSILSPKGPIYEDVAAFPLASQS